MAVEAQALAHLGQTAQAVEAIQSALRLTPDNAQLADQARRWSTLSSATAAPRSSTPGEPRTGGVDASWFALPFSPAAARRARLPSRRSPLP